MKFEIWMIGKTNSPNLISGENLYLERLRHYHRVDWVILPEPKRSKALSINQIKLLHSSLFIDRLKKMKAHLILLDEGGKQYSSVQFSNKINQLFHTAGRTIVFCIGGAYGFSDELYQLANDKISLSKMTFSHQMVRLIFLEQLYRAMTILSNEPYHH